MYDRESKRRPRVSRIESTSHFQSARPGYTFSTSRRQYHLLKVIFTLNFRPISGVGGSISSHSDYDSSADESGAEDDGTSLSSGVSDSGYQRQRIVPRDRVNDSHEVVRTRLPRQRTEVVIWHYARNLGTIFQPRNTYGKIQI